MPSLILLFFLAIAGCTRSPQLGKKIVVDVNGQSLSAARFSQELAYRLRDLDALEAKDPHRLGEVKNHIVQDFEVQTLATQWAKRHNLILKAETLDAEIQKVRSSYPDNLAFQQELAGQGISFHEWRDRLEKSLIQKMVVEKINQAVESPTDAELKNYYQVHKDQFKTPAAVKIVQMILSSETDAKLIDQQLRKGHTLSSLAKKYAAEETENETPRTLWIHKGESPIFESAFKIKIGTRSPVLKSEFGYHIFEVLARRPAKNQSFSDVKGQIRRNILEKRQQAAYLSWLDQQLRKSRVFKDQAFIDALKIETKAD